MTATGRLGGRILRGESKERRPPSAGGSLRRVTMGAFWIYWLASAASSKHSVRGGRRRQLTGVSVILIFAIAGALRGGSPAVPSVILAAIGAVPFACGIALAVWARLHLGRNWGMPMTQRAEPELVDNLLGLIVVAVLVAYFYYSGTVEERNLTATFPQAYPEYRSKTKMLIPFLL
jgi:protein-S-isoprenylcysteine O-methyltransferase Ste14